MLQTVASIIAMMGSHLSLHKINYDMLYMKIFVSVFRLDRDGTESRGCAQLCSRMQNYPLEI